MSVTLEEHRLGGLRWIVLNGPDREAFGTLGEHVRAELAGPDETWPMLPRLRRYVATPPGRDHLASVRRATTEQYGEEWAELAAFAAGATLPFEDLALLNLRGDLGWTDGRMGCSDLAWRRDRSVIAHNEDGGLTDLGRCGLLTLTGNGRPPVTAFWYPGFLPANAFAVTGDGLVWTVDHLPVPAPGPGAGRHFVGRGLQRSARSAGQVVDYLRDHPSAGGFAYTVGDRAGRVVNVEAAAGRHAVAEAGPGAGPLLWHTNHGRYVSGAEPSAGGTSAARGATLSALALPATDPGPSWFLDILTRPPPAGVRSDPGPDGQGLTTLCTLVADLTAGQAVIAAREGQAGHDPAGGPGRGQPTEGKRIVTYWYIRV